MNKYKKSLIITLALQTLFFVLWFVPMVSYSVPGMSYGGTDRFVDCFEGASGLFACFVIFHIIAMICTGFPLMRRNLDKPRRFITPKISMFLTLALWLFIVSSMANWKNEYSDYGAKCGFTFGGWLFLITMVLLGVMLFLLSYQAKANCEQMEKAEFIENAYAKRANAAEEPVPVGGWRCTCGKAHPGYVSSCSCGVNKKDVPQQTE